MASIKNGWLIDAHFCEKRFKAVLHVCGKIFLQDDDAQNVFASMPVVTFYTPSLNTAGQVKSMVRGVLVYLAPTLEYNSQRDVNFVVAHELAHVFLRHHEKNNQQMKEQAEEYADRPSEKAADALAEKWGFPKRKKGQTDFVKLTVSWLKERDRRRAERAERKAVRP